MGAQLVAFAGSASRRGISLCRGGLTHVPSLTITIPLALTFAVTITVTVTITIPLALTFAVTVTITTSRSVAITFLTLKFTLRIPVTVTPFTVTFAVTIAVQVTVMTASTPPVINRTIVSISTTRIQRSALTFTFMLPTRVSIFARDVVPI